MNLESLLEAIYKDNLFDERWYLRCLNRLSNYSTNPVLHYLSTGWKMGINPSRKFDGNRYLEQNEDVKQAGICPLVHYILYGKNEGRMVDVVSSYKEKTNQDDNSVYLLKSNRDWNINIKSVHLVAVEHCTNKCEYCSTSSQFTKPKYYNAEDFFPWLDRKRLLNHTEVFGQI